MIDSEIIVNVLSEMKTMVSSGHINREKFNRSVNWLEINIVFTLRRMIVMLLTS